MKQKDCHDKGKTSGDRRDGEQSRNTTRTRDNREGSRNENDNRIETKGDRRKQTINTSREISLRHEHKGGSHMIDNEDNEINMRRETNIREKQEADEIHRETDDENTIPEVTETTREGNMEYEQTRRREHGRRTRRQPIRDEQIEKTSKDTRTTMESQENDEDIRWMTYYGDDRESNTGTEMDKTAIRVGTYNINTFPKLGSIRSRRLQQEMRELDCAGMSEINKNWYKVNTQDSFRRRIDEWWKEHKTRHAWLRDRKWQSEFQQGGVSLSTIGRTSYYSQDKGEDPAGLGRWCWQKLEGHSRTKTAVIQIYRPVKNTNDYGSTYMQQRSTAGIIDPVQTFDKDLIEEVDRFKSEDYQIIIMGDFNTNLNGKGRLEAKLQERGIMDVLQERYGRETTPGTHIRGRHPIDGIMASDTLHMVRGGYTGGMSEISDHRMVWADFSMDTVLGIDRGEIVKPKGKKLQLSNRKRTERFNKKFREQVDRHKLITKIRKLESEIGDTKHMSSHHGKIYESVYEQRERATRHAEAKCAKLPETDDPFSPELQRALGTQVIMKQIMTKKKKGKPVHKRWLINMKTKWQIKAHLDVAETVEGAEANFKQATMEYQQKQKQSPELRSRFLDHLIQEATDNGNDRKVKDLRAIKERELMRDVHARIKLARGVTRGGGVRFVHKVGDDGQIKTIQDKYEMEKEIMRANEAKLHSANESPLRQGELSRLITDSNYEQWEKLIEGTIDLPDGLEEGTRRWLEKFKGIKIEDPEIQISTEDYIKGWNKVREHTSCAPGGIHFGTFKASRWCDIAAELHTRLARIPIKTGYTPEQWTYSVDSMLPKKEGEWRANKLRLTSLLRPDYNHNNKILGREAMRRAEEAKKLAPEQYGSRKGLSAEKHALNKRLLVDILRVQKRPGIICANDAKACYDRILHFSAYISIRRAGIPKEAAQSMLEPIRQMKHYIRTAYGDSEFYYGGERPEWGLPGQRSGACNLGAS